MKRIVASALILSILSSSAAICYGMNDDIYDLDDFSAFQNGDISKEMLKKEEERREAEKKYNEAIEELNKAVEEQKRLDEQTKAEKTKQFEALYRETTHEAEDLYNKELKDFVKKRRDEEDQNRTFSLIKDTFDEAKAEEERIAREKAEEEERQHKETVKNVCIGAGVTLAVAAVITTIITTCVIYKDQIKKFFCEDVKNFFTKTLPNAFKAKKAN